MIPSLEMEKDFGIREYHAKCQVYHKNVANGPLPTFQQT